MNSFLRGFLAFVAGILVGGLVNMALVKISAFIVAPPEGVDVTTAEGLKAGIELFGPQHFIMPFLAHALGSLSGAFVAAKIASKNQMTFGVVIGLFFLTGGIAAAVIIPAPFWFIALDLLLAYLPMAFLGVKLARKK